MAKAKGPTHVDKYHEAIDVKEGSTAYGQTVVGRKVFRKRNEGFRRVRLTLEDGTVREARERFRVPVVVEL